MLARAVRASSARRDGPRVVVDCWTIPPISTCSASDAAARHRDTRDRCVVATIVERSVTASRWEGSTAVLAALGVETGFSSCTKAHGTATGVTVTLE